MHVKTIFSYSHKDAVYQFLASNSQFQLLRFSKNFFMMAVTLTYNKSTGFTLPEAKILV